MKQITFEIETTNVDGSAMTAAQIATLTFVVYIDTVTPPVKSYPVPAANVAAAVVDPTSGLKVVTVKPADIGFVPVPSAKYYVDATETSGAGTSGPSNIASITEAPPPFPKPPANLAVS